MSTLGRFCLALTLMMSISLAGFSQNPAPMQPGNEAEARADFSDSDLEQFVETAQKLIPIEIAAQEKMAEEVESTGLTVERFNEISTMQQLGMEGNVSEEEMDEFNKASEKIAVVQEEAESEIKNVLEEDGMTLEEFQEIMSAYHQDPAVRQRVDEKMSM
ncbi:MAG: DUF4168 domain-containing protein [Cytophagaceae bacterium]